eukprot:366051-Chlamydomonas_euryale.AAC.8
MTAEAVRSAGSAMPARESRGSEGAEARAHAASHLCSVAAVLQLAATPTLLAVASCCSWCCTHSNDTAEVPESAKLGIGFGDRACSTVTAPRVRAGCVPPNPGLRLASGCGAFHAWMHACVHGAMPHTVTVQERMHMFRDMHATGLFPPRRRDACLMSCCCRVTNVLLFIPSHSVPWSPLLREVHVAGPISCSKGDAAGPLPTPSVHSKASPIRLVHVVPKMPLAAQPWHPRLA